MNDLFTDYSFVFFLFFSIAVFILACFTLVTKLSFLVLLIFIAFFGTGLSEYGVIPPEVNWLTEVLIIGFFIKTMVECIVTGRKIKFFGGTIISIFIIIVAVSSLFNHVSIIGAFLFLRIILRFYLLMITIINMDYDEAFMVKINKLIAWLFIIQIPTAIVRMLIHGGIAEGNIGTYAMSGGGATTTIPLVAIGFLATYNFLNRKSLTNLWLCLGFIAFSVIGAKRGFVFYLPVILCLISWKLRGKIKGYFRYLTVSLIIFLLSLYLVPRLLPSMNPQNKVWGEFNISHIVNYVKDYNTRTSDRKATGRVSATISTYKYLTGQGTYVSLLGRGPGTVLKSTFESFDKPFTGNMDIGIKYGMTGLNWLALQIGYVGAAVWFFFYLYNYARLSSFFKNESNSYWRAFNLGMLTFSAIAMVMNLTYDRVLIVHDTVSMVYFVLLGFSIKKNEILCLNNGS